MTIPTPIQRAYSPVPNGDRVALVAHLAALISRSVLIEAVEQPTMLELAIDDAVMIAQKLVDAVIAAERQAGR